MISGSVIFFGSWLHWIEILWDNSDLDIEYNGFGFEGTDVASEGRCVDIAASSSSRGGFCSESSGDTTVEGGDGVETSEDEYSEGEYSEGGNSSWLPESEPGGDVVNDKPDGPVLPVASGGG